MKIVFTGGQTAPAPPPPAPPPPAQQTEPPTVALSDRGQGESTPRSHILEWSLIGGGAAVGVAGAVLMIVEAAKTGNADNNHDRSAYDSAMTGWRVGLTGTIVGAAAVAGGGILFAVSKSSDGARGSRNPLWIGVGANVVRMGGTW